MPVLLYRPNIAKDECPVSYLIRVAEGNGFKNLNHLLYHYKAPIENMEAAPLDILTGNVDLKHTYYLMGLQYQNAQSINTHQKFRSGVDTPFVFVTHPKGCPQCLLEDGYCKLSWSFLPIIVCDKHDLILCDKIITNGKKLHWQRSTLNPFNAGHKGDRACRNAYEFSQYFYSLIANEACPFSMPEPLKGFELPDALSLVHFIAHFQARLENNYFKPNNMRIETLTERYVDAWCAIKQWPESFYDLHNQYLSKIELKIAGRHFRDLYEYLVEHKESAALNMVKDAFVKYVEVENPSLVHYVYKNKVS